MKTETCHLHNSIPSKDLPPYSFAYETLSYGSWRYLKLKKVSSQQIDESIEFRFIYKTAIYRGSSIFPSYFSFILKACVL